ncbi:MAG: CPBP family intramembrane metalloprotease [Spirochaetaceae bacterium]|nr:CPBP family intramembrane metalloprotease [Spirochaetaceae bacterium]
MRNSKANPETNSVLGLAHFKGTAIKDMLEALVLFFVLFFPRPGGDFSFTGELILSFCWRIPAVLLVVILLKKNLPPGKKDLSVGCICLPALCITGFLISLGASRYFPPPKLPVPSGPLAWTAVVFSSLTTGYLEEGYFRLYLPERLRRAALGPVKSLVIPILIFALCHAYEGPWGFTNALLAGTILSLGYRKMPGFHGIALAHGIYNILAYLSGALLP